MARHHAATLSSMPWPSSTCEAAARSGLSPDSGALPGASPGPASGF